MSAYAVTHGTIRLLIEASRKRNPMDPHAGPLRWYHNGQSHDAGFDQDRADYIGKMLCRENANSLDARYPGAIKSAEGDMYDPSWLDYIHQDCNKSLTPAQLFKAAHCYVYQACEHPGWETSEAKAFIDALCHRWEGFVQGYTDAKWGASVEWEPKVTVQS